MFFMFWLVLITLGSLALGLWVGYLFLVKTVGKTAAKRNFLDMLPMLAIVYATIFGINFLDDAYQYIIFPGLYMVILAFWLISWPVRKRAAGRLLLDVGRPPQNKYFVWIGLFEGALAAVLTWEATTRWPLEGNELLRTLSLLTGLWLVTGLFFLLNMSRMEFREGGLCYLCRYISWDRLTAYQWEPLKPETLTLHYRPRFPLLPKFLTLKMPADKHEEIERVVAMRLTKGMTAQ
ncbi:MAG: hypothetical protein ACFB16_06105 [Phormidesmis sp.]